MSVRAGKSFDKLLDDPNWKDRALKAEAQLAAVREVIAEKLMMEWATHSGEPPMDVKDVLEDVRKAAIGEVKK